MSLHLQRELEKLRRMILALGADVEDNLRRAAEAVRRRDMAAAREVVARDRGIDLTEVAIEEECMKTLALHQPVAVDLRFIVSILKIDHYLERVGDHAVSIAEAALSLRGPVGAYPVPDLGPMARKAMEMLKGGLDALVEWDAELARRVWAEDDLVDDMNRDICVRMLEGMRDDPVHSGDYSAFISISRSLERVADHAANVAKDVIYMVEGDIVRHRRERALPAVAEN
jgi:phosphate transport system protein